MFSKAAIPLLCACLSSLAAAEMDPRLAPPSAIYLKQLKEIQDRGFDREEKAVGTYLAELKAAEDKATKGGDVKLLSTLARVKGQVEMGEALPVPDTDLPKLQQAQHKTYYKAHEEAQNFIGKQKKQLDATYLATLAKLQPAAAADPALATQIELEKKRVISGNFGPISNLQTQIGGTKWQSVADPQHFEFFSPDGRYSHWRYTTPDAETVVVHWNANSSISWKLGKDGKTLLKGGAPDLRLVPGGK